MQAISNQLGEINNKLHQFIDIQTVEGISTGKLRKPLPIIKEKILSPCEPFIEGIHRGEDLSNIYSLLTSTNKPLWLYGERGIGKTELIRRFASQHPEYEYIFTSFSGSINQTVSQNLFFFSEYELYGMELQDIVRYQKNMAVFSEYSRQLKEELRSLILIIDNYDPVNYEKDCGKEIGLDIHSGISGEKSDLKEILELQKTGVKVILMAQKKPKDSDVYAAYEIRGLNENEHFAVMTRCFAKIGPHLDEEGICEKLSYLIRIAGRRTDFVTIMAFAMQNSKLEPKEALNRMIESFVVDEAYGFRYSSDTLNMYDHIERILEFIDLSYMEKQMLAILAMMPAQGMEYNLFRKLTTANSVQLDKIRQAALQKFIDMNIIIEEYQQKELQTSAGLTRMIRMDPLVADHALRVLVGKESGTLLNSIRINWVTRLIHYISNDELKSLKKKDSKYAQIPMLTEACSATEQCLRKIGKRFKCDEELAVSRRDLLMKASELCDKTGNVKDALEYVERAIAIEGPYPDVIDSFVQRMNSIGMLFYEGGKYSRAQECFLKCITLLNAKNNIFPEEDVKGFDSYDIERLTKIDNVGKYTSLFNNIAMAFEARGSYEEALKYHSKALAICERVLGSEHPNTAKTYNNMGDMYHVQGDYENALEYYGKALAIRERVLGVKHQDTATTYNNIAWVYREQGNYEEALKYYERAYAMHLSVFGEKHPSTQDVQLSIEIMEKLIATGLTEDELKNFLPEE